MVDINENKVTYNGNTYQFKYDVLEAELMNGKLLIVFHPDNPECLHNNVCCYSLQNELLWRIKEPSDQIAGTARYPYVGISKSDEYCAVVDFYGRRFGVDLQTGEILSKDIVK